MLSGASVLFSMLAMLAVGKMFTNALSPTGVAVLTLALLWADFFNLVANAGLSVSLPKLVAAAEPGEQARISGACLSFQTVFAAVLGAVVFLAIPMVVYAQTWFEANMHFDLMLLPLFLALLPPLFFVGVLRDASLASLAGLNRYGQRAMGVVVSSCMQVLFVGAAIVVFNADVAGIALAMAASYAVAVVWLMAALPKGARWQRNGAVAWQCLKFSVPLYINSLLTFAFQRFDTVLLLALLQSPTAVALYEVAKRVPTMLSRALNALLVPFLPTIAELSERGEREDATKFLQRTLLITGFLGYLAVFLIVLIQEPLIIVLFNRDYLATTAILGLLTTAICIAVQAGLMGQTLIALGHPSLVTYVNIFTAIFSIVANIILVSLMGIMGAGIAAVLTAALSFSAQLACVMRKGLRLHRMQCLWPHILLLTAGLGLYITGNPVWARFTAVILFVVLCVITRVVRMNDLRTLLSALRPAVK